MKNIFFLLIVLLLAGSVSYAQSRDEKAIAAAVESLNKAILDADKATLEALTSENLSYGHSSGLIEDKAAFVEALVSGASDFTHIDITNQTVNVTGNIGHVRHQMHGEANNNPVHIGIVMVWEKKDNAWKLLARQAYKL